VCYPFLFHCPAAHRALPSFPTRRSSDLEPGERTVHRGQADPRVLVAERGVQGLRAHEAPRLGEGLAYALTLPRVPLHLLLDHGRSEEHTSELQSRENLVCRLLLEKKKHK